MGEFRFSTDVTVRFAETDAQGVAHNSNYLVWFEVARVAYLAEYAGGYQALRDQGLESFVLESHVRYGKPAHFDDRLRIHARIGELRGARFRFDYEITRGGELMVVHSSDGRRHERRPQPLHAQPGEKRVRLGARSPVVKLVLEEEGDAPTA